MGFSKKSGKEKTAQARSSKAPLTRPPAYPKMQTINSNTTKGKVAAWHNPNSEENSARLQLRPSFGSTNVPEGDIDSIFVGLSLSDEDNKGVRREILPSSKDVPRQIREPTSTKHGEDPSSSSRGRDRDWPSQTAQVQEGVKELTNQMYHQAQVKQFDPLSSQPQKSFDPPELQEKKSKKAVYLKKTVFWENDRHCDKGRDVGKDPPTRAAASAENKLSSKKPGRMPNKIVQGSRSNSQDYDDSPSLSNRRSNASSLAAHPSINQNDHRDDNFDSVVDRHANYPNSQDEEYSVEHSTRDENESIVSTNAKIAYHQDDTSNFGESPCCLCAFFQCNDNNDDVITYTNNSVYNDGDEDSDNILIGGKSNMVDDVRSDGSSSASCSVSTDDTRTFLSENDTRTFLSEDDTRTFLSEKSDLDDDGRSNGNNSASCSVSLDDTTPSDGTAYIGQPDDRTDYTGLSKETDGKSLVDGSGSHVAKEEEDESSKTTILPADKDTGWWFGCGRFGSAVQEEHEGMSTTPSNYGTGYTGQTKETMCDEKSLVNGDGSIVAKEDEDKFNKTNICQNCSFTTIDSEAYTTASVNGGSNAPDPPRQQKNASVNGGSNAPDPPQQQKHDREGCLLPSSKPVLKVPSLTKSLKKLKGRSNSGDKGGDKLNSNVSYGTPPSISINSSDKSMCSTKSLKKSPKNEKPMNEKVQGTSKFTVDKSLWDSDDRQRDLYCAEPGGIENLTVRQYRSIPKPNAPDHVLVKVEASTVSSRDCSVRANGDPNTAPNLFIPGFQAVGQVCAVGTKVDPLKIRLGDRVAALLPNGGGNAKYVSIPVSWAIILPEGANHDDIICLVANYMTAYQCLKLAKKDGAPLTNANVLITGGSGPVGQALIELALQEGANVYSTAHKMHEEHLTKLGTKWFSVKPEKWLPVLQGKMDVVVDNLKINEYESSHRALTDSGVLICNVGPDMGIWWSSLRAKLLGSRAIFYEVHESFRTNPRLFAHELHYLICKLQRGEIRPKVAGRVTLNQVPKAQQLLGKGLPNGTVVCLPWKNLDPSQKVKVETWG